MPPATRPALARQLTGAVILLNLLIGAILIIFLQQSYRQYQAHADLTARNLSTVLKENISATIREIDVALDGLAQDIEGSPATARPDLLRQRLARQPALRAVRVFDAAGQLRHGPPLPLAMGGGAAEQDYFLALRAAPFPGLAISQPTLAPGTRLWQLQFARALRRPDGRFDGVVCTEVDLHRLSNAFALISVGQHGAMTLTSSEEQVYARYARLSHDESMTGKIIKSASLRDYVASGQRPDSYLFKSPLDGLERLNSLQRVFDRPLLVAPRNLYFSVGLATDDYMQKWYEETYLAALVMLLSLLCSAGGAWALLRFWRERVANQEQLRAFEREHAVNEARLHILQDLHDGVGSQLLSTLMMVQSGAASTSQTVTLLQECMDDMRLALDTLSPDEPDLLPVLGNFRFRMEARFQGVGLQLRWTNHWLPETLAIAPHNGLQVLRILQEALANVLRHAGARTVTLDMFFTKQLLSVQIRDDGRGFTPEAGGAGHGIRNMRLRALRLGASLEIYPLQPGTAIDLGVPLG